MPLGAHRGYYRLLLDTARTGLRDGLSALDTVGRCELGTFADLPDAERVVLNLHRTYADITGHEFNLAQALTDTVAFHGGPMHTAV
jgi:cyclase